MAYDPYPSGIISKVCKSEYNDLMLGQYQENIRPF